MLITVVFLFFVCIDSGVTVDVWTSYAARIMAISVIPFVIVQLPQVLNSTSGRHLAVLVALILSVLMLISYCVYQVHSQPLDWCLFAFCFLHLAYEIVLFVIGVPTMDPKEKACFCEAQACYIRNPKAFETTCFGKTS